MPTVEELAAQREVRATLEWFRSERSWINEQHLNLCRIAAPTFFEKERAEWMAAQFEQLGWEARLDRAGNVVANLRGWRDASPLAITAHLDTVLAPRAADDIRSLGEGKLSGPGVSDNGAGLAALLALAAAWKAAAPLADSELAPLLVATVGEEGEGNLGGMRYFCRGEKIRKFRGFLVLDGPGVEHITSRALASRRMEVVVSGPGGHSWRDSTRPNPVHALASAVTRFVERARAESGGKPRASHHVSILEGGSSINSIPAEALAKADLRSEDAARLAALAELLTDCASAAVDQENSVSGGGRVTLRVREIGSRPAGELPSGAPLLETIRAVDQHLGIRSRTDCSSTDANVPLSLQLPAVSLGVGGQGGGAHTPGEWYSPQGREQGLSRILLVSCLMLLLAPASE